MILHRFVRLAALLAACFAAPAWACSMSGDYVRPTNFELVQLSEAIAIATAETQSGEGDNLAVTFRIVSVLKGAPPQRLTIRGTFFTTPRPSNLRDLSGAHPDSYAGACNRYSFARGGRYLLFLDRIGDGEWTWPPFAFSRVNEDYSGEGDPWIRSVRRYLAVQRDPDPMAQLASLRAMIANGRDAHGARLGATELADLRDHFRSLSPFKPTAFLIDALERLQRGEPLPFGVRPDAANRENSDAERMAGLLIGDEPEPERPDDAGAQRVMILEALVNGTHPDALPLFERLWAAPDASPRVTGLTLRFLARNGQYPRAYRWIETSLPALLARLDDAAAGRLLGDVAEVQRGDDWEEGHERWRTDPHAAATWPELAFALSRRFPETFMDAIHAIPVTDYRARPELTMALAGDFDEGAQAWALAALGRPAPTLAADADDRWRADPDLLPLRVLVTAWAADREPLLTGFFCQGGRRRALLIRALGQWGDLLYYGLLARMAVTPGASAEEHGLLVHAALAMTARDASPSGAMQLLSHDENEWLLTRLLKGEPVRAQPLRCPG